ncbi:hypothetical protein BIU99_07655 [Plantibacter sp. MMLR14_011]|nr:hypothetical protein BIU99_07655 [Plantibacter sp. MMLR14_011]
MPGQASLMVLENWDGRHASCGELCGRRCREEADLICGTLMNEPELSCYGCGRSVCSCLSFERGIDT